MDYIVLDLDHFGKENHMTSNATNVHRISNSYKQNTALHLVNFKVHTNPFPMFCVVKVLHKICAVGGFMCMSKCADHKGNQIFISFL